MRRPSLHVLPLLFVLAACGAQGAGDNQASTPTPAGPEPAAAPAAGNDSAGIADFRAQWMEACIGGARDAAPPGAPVERHCACAIDRVMAGKSLEQLEAEQASGAYRAPFQSEMRACIRDIPS
ncbi:MAG: hypothetical protein AB7O91_02540 [Sphingomonas sp.]